jgi:hypothetical protein
MAEAISDCTVGRTSSRIFARSFVGAAFGRFEESLTLHLLRDRVS